MIRPLLHERSCKKIKSPTRATTTKELGKKKHAPQQQQRNELRKQTPTTTTKNLENKHPPNNKKELGKQTRTPTTTTTRTKNLENKHPPQQITHHHHHHNNNKKRKLEKRILCLSGKFSRIYAQELQDEHASAMVNELIKD
jgi:predicted ribonuclease toxin of YeeF-YezG toxin-antitoxin module